MQGFEVDWDETRGTVFGEFLASCRSSDNTLEAEAPGAVAVVGAAGDDLAVAPPAGDGGI